MRLYGQVGYEAYVKKTGGKSLVTGDDLLKWKDLPEVIKEAWIEAGNEIAREFMSNSLDN